MRNGFACFKLGKIFWRNFLEFLEFKKEDAVFCFKVRTTAFIEKFYNELDPSKISASVTSFLPDDFIKMSKQMKFFIIFDNHKKIGFFCIKKINKKTAEIPLIYLDFPYIGKGYGSKAMSFIEDWVRENWINVNKIFLDTIIPRYNGGFYRKVGYKEKGSSKCVFNNIKVHAIRFEKNLI
jgi:GNAT superfamily N-acetyltransferase